jgi:hypothetical protein
MTNKQKSRILNSMLEDSYSEESFIENFIYLTNKNRGDHTTERAMRNAYRNGKAGDMLMKYDSIAANQMLSDRD